MKTRSRAALFLALSLACRARAADVADAPAANAGEGARGAGTARAETGAQASPFALNRTLDGIAIASGAASWAAGFILENTIVPEPPKDVPYDKALVNAFDYTLMPGWGYNHPLDIAGDITCVTSLALPAAAYGIGFAAHGISGRDIATLSAMYAEALLWSEGLKTILKAAVQRARPYMYETSRPDGAESDRDSLLSFPSGHTTSAFTGAGFLTYTFLKYFPDSAWRAPVIAVSYAAACATGALRVLSENHFATDVIAGAALGTLCGIGVPLLHELFARAGSGVPKRGALAASVSPAAVRFSIAL